MPHCKISLSKWWNPFSWGKCIYLFQALDVGVLDIDLELKHFKSEYSTNEDATIAFSLNKEE